MACGTCSRTISKVDYDLMMALNTLFTGFFLVVALGAIAKIVFWG